MAYEVLARKWRPKQLEDVIGQEHVTRTLSHAIENNRVAHAYLFVGPRGIGKTSLSRIFAKALDCEHGPTPHPCDECDLCKEIMAGNSLDVIEIDAASNTGVDNIRDIRDSIQFAPARARFKIYIIDEVHMLSTGAFNALLKTLEEPPPHAKFIFATTEVDKLPATIISRCQRFDLRRIPTAEIVKALKRIATAEGVTADNDALLAIARGAEGGMRDALSALDQIISFKGQQVTEADVLAVFGLVSRSQLEALATSILKGDMANGLRIIDELDHGGKDLRRLVIELMSHFRNLLVRQQLGEDALSALDATPEQLATLDEQAKLADSGRVLRIAEHLADLENRIRFALSRRTIFETVFLRCCRAATVVTLDQVIRQLAALQSGQPLPQVTTAPAPAPATTRPQAPAASAPAPATTRPQAPAAPAPAPATTRPQATAAPAPAPATTRPQAPAAPAKSGIVIPSLPHAPSAAPAASHPSGGIIVPHLPQQSAPKPAVSATVPTADHSKALEAPAIKKAIDLFKGQVVGVEDPKPVECTEPEMPEECDSDCGDA